MKTKTTITLLAVLGALALTANAQDNTPPSDVQPPKKMGGSGDQPRAGFHLLPPPLVQQLKLMDDQKTQVAALEADTKAKLEKILTADQLTQLKNFRPPGGRGMGMSGQQRGGMGHIGNGPQDDGNFSPPGEGDNNPPAGPPPGSN